jgi:ABC-type antimicrobial peptide transport system permease subunit
MNLLQDLRFAVRLLKKSPSFTIIAILTLALGIGANSAIFSVVHSVLLHSLPFSHPDQLIDIFARSTVFDFPHMGLSLADINDIRSSAASLETLAIYSDSPKELSGAGNPQRLESTEVTEDFFPLLGVQPLHGRGFTSADMQPGSRSVILSYELWRDNFGADPSAIGKIVMLDGKPQTIIGVMPAFAPLGFATDSKLWTAFLPTKEQQADRANHEYSVLARLRPHVSVTRAQSELDTISSRLATAYPDFDKGWSVHATSLAQSLLGDARTPLAILFCAVGFVLLIACANVGNLFLARGWSRRREFAIRSAIGASRSALLRQLIIESLVIALAGGACAFLFATVTLQALRSSLPPDIPRLHEIQIDAPVALFTVAVSLIAALLSGLAPAFLSTRSDAPSGRRVWFRLHSFPHSVSHSYISSLRSFLCVLRRPSNLLAQIKNKPCHSEIPTGERPQPRRLVSQPGHVFLSRDPTKLSSSTPHNFLRQSLVVAEIALAAILLIGATLALRSFSSLLHMDLGFRPDHVLTVRLDFPNFRFPAPDPAITFVQQILETTRATPGVTAASVGLVYPMSDEVAETTFETEATFAADPNAQQSALGNRVAPNFFRTLGISLLAGRDFTPADAKGKSPVFIVNESLAKKYFGSTDVIGKRFSVAGAHPVWGEIVGVAGNVRGRDRFDAGDQAKPQVYAPFYQTPRIFGVYLVVRSASNTNPLTLVPALQDRIWSVDKNQPITAVATLNQRIAEVNASPRSQTILLGIFAALGFLLALIGVYGVMSYLVGLQTREIGIRMALGAAPAQVLRLVLTHGLKLTLAGVAFGLLSALALTRFVSTLLFGISSSDPLTYAAVSILLITIATAAILLPARRASRIDPILALRHD